MILLTDFLLGGKGYIIDYEHEHEITKVIQNGTKLYTLVVSIITTAF